jgi:hypothetical protein
MPMNIEMEKTIDATESELAVPEDPLHQVTVCVFYVLAIIIVFMILGNAPVNGTTVGITTLMGLLGLLLLVWRFS